MGMCPRGREASTMLGSQCRNMAQTCQSPPAPPAVACVLMPQREALNCHPIVLSHLFLYII